MAQYSVTHTCGHQQTHQIYGPDTRYNNGTTRRQYIADQRAEEPCQDCARTAKRQQHAPAAQAATEQAAAEGLPALTGSPKQIAWGEQLRRSAITALDEAMTRIPEHLVAPATAIYTRIISRENTASWWIDARDPGGTTVHPGILKQIATDEDRAALRELFEQAKAPRAQPYATPRRETVTATIPAPDTSTGLTARQAAEQLGVSLSTIYRRCRTGSLTATKTDRRWTITL